MHIYICGTLSSTSVLFLTDPYRTFSILSLDFNRERFLALQNKSSWQFSMCNPTLGASCRWLGLMNLKYSSGKQTAGQSSV